MQINVFTNRRINIFRFSKSMKVFLRKTKWNCDSNSEVNSHGTAVLARMDADAALPAMLPLLPSHKEFEVVSRRTESRHSPTKNEYNANFIIKTVDKKLANFSKIITSSIGDVC